MGKIQVKLATVGVAIFMSCLTVAHAQESKAIPLPDPQVDGGRALMQVLGDRISTREFAAREIPRQVLSNLLWAAFGVSRSNGRRTAPSAYNMQEIDIYVATPEGLYLWDATANALQPILNEDIRAATGTQPYVGTAPLNLIYVADYTKMQERTEEEKPFYAATDTGFIAENAYLFCASEKLSCVVRALIEREALAKKMKLRPDQHITLAQTIGYPVQ